jgi:hypothetical protein
VALVALAAVALVVAFAGFRASAEDSRAESLLERSFSNLYADDYIQTMELSTSVGGARPLTRTLQITRKQSVRPGKALVRFLEPFDIRWTSILILEDDGGSDVLYVFLPALDLTRRLSAAQRADSFFGTDLSYEDIEPKHASDYEVRVLPRDATSSDACLPVEWKARQGFTSTYDRMVSCIEKERAVFHWTDFYRHDRHVKRLEIDLDRVAPVGTRSIPFWMTMRTLRTGSETRVVTQSYELRNDIPEKLFSTWNLQAGDAERDRSHAGEKVD